MAAAGSIYKNGLLVAGPVSAAAVWFALRSAGLEPDACWCGAHRRIAVGMVKLVGARGDRRVVLGAVLITAVCYLILR